ncbi:LOW QUALITY PROTEIN: actin-related protein 6-like [Haliotis rubra]|uniref:LOW QUALITY PROTEIN: actin-related protein 6-like n=1 Tax=Haliotis rubra TaxID=36100 RepID=UPI001EE5322A|nr:LOW QUALITY PROTEIN: actin-related protein 6-like [Haliotis rubra]XP_046574690.1 LOW QUALITY PROTEIN: actin-related protein 6-like [Haliotis rubra]
MAVLVLDNGAGTAKVGYATDKEPRIIPNCVTKAKNVRTRIFIGDQIDECKDLSGLYYMLPFQKGFLTNWDIERQVWDYILGKDVFQVNSNECTAIVTEPCFNFASAQEAMNEVFFEEYQFNALYRCNASCLSQYKSHKEESEKNLCTLVVDTGYSYTHIVPYFKGKKIKEAIRRVNVGGKLLTNHLKEIISYRQLMVMDETYVINQVKEDVCYVATDFYADMNVARKRGKENTIARDYVLPDYTHIKRGYVRPQEDTTGKAKDNEQLIRMNNERFAVAELLFHPSDVGIQEMGIPEAIINSLEPIQEEMKPHLLGNILLTGGNCHLRGFDKRMYSDVRKLAPGDYDVTVSMPKNPTSHAWEGGCLLAKDPDFSKMVVTKQEFDEHGPNICYERFDV